MGRTTSESGHRVGVQSSSLRSNVQFSESLSQSYTDQATKAQQLAESKMQAKKMKSLLRVSPRLIGISSTSPNTKPNKHLCKKAIAKAPPPHQHRPSRSWITWSTALQRIIVLRGRAHGSLLVLLQQNLQLALVGIVLLLLSKWGQRDSTLLQNKQKILSLPLKTSQSNGASKTLFRARSKPPMICVKAH